MSFARPAKTVAAIFLLSCGVQLSLGSPAAQAAEPRTTVAASAPAPQPVPAGHAIACTTGWQ
ncbi:hypothetical protein ACMATS_24490 [Streptoverticillium reticulum]|uniref:hypothetical protein n=1 Tax=Streptoverticillium reticulum TaxID=1433415 RepID=UPI0039BF0296